MSFIWQHGQETTGIARVPEYGGGIKDSTDRQSQFQVGGLGDLRELPRRVWAPESQPPTFWVILKLDHELCCILYRLSVTYYWVAKSCNTSKCNILSTITLSDSPPNFSFVLCKSHDWPQSEQGPGPGAVVMAMLMQVTEVVQPCLNLDVTMGNLLPGKTYRGLILSKKRQNSLIKCWIQGTVQCIFIVLKALL